MRREIFVPNPSGFHSYHTHVTAGANLNEGQYNCEVVPIYVESKNEIETRNYDREEFIVLKEFEPYFMHGGDMVSDFLAGDAIPELKAIQEKAENESLIKQKNYEVGVASRNGLKRGLKIFNL